jgi:minor histocompatibility antigen H13
MSSAALPDEIYIAYAAILALAMIPIYIGSHLSLTTKSEDKEEAMTAHDAYMFPLIGSGVLFGLYMLFKYFNPEWINFLLSAYFLILGFISLSKTFSPIMSPYLPGLSKQKITEFTIPVIPYLSEKPVHVKATMVDVLAWILSALVVSTYVNTKHWLLNNLLGLSFSVQGVALFNLGSYKIGCILLGGLFLYDIFWVFGTDVMVTVAKSFDAPIKLLFPKNIFAAKFQFSMLGLGDIVIPGIFIALLLRYDYHRAKATPGSEFPKPYFRATFLGYFLGLLTTIFVMHTFQAAQPALLYLVPFCVGFSFLTALSEGDVDGLLKYTEEKEEKDIKSH